MEAYPHPELYKAVWYWKDDLLVHSVSEEKQSITKTQRAHLDTIGGKVISFSENVDQNKQALFKKKYQRPIQKSIPNVVTLQDIKDVVTFLAIGSIPKDFLSLFHSYEINKFLRALIVYFQLYLYVKEDLRYRRDAYTSRLKHPISTERETLCRNQLSNLRSRIGQQYTLLIVGEGIYKQFHHMNNTILRSYFTKDVKLYDYLLRFSTRVVWIALSRTYFKEIENEMLRLFGSKNVSRDYLDYFDLYRDQQIIHGTPLDVGSHLIKRSAVVLDIYLNRNSPDFKSGAFASEFLEENIISGVDALLNLPEELFNRFELNLGILGQPRTNFETMLHVKQERPVTAHEENLAIALAQMLDEIEKPSLKMYEYLKQLNTSIDLQKHSENDGNDFIKEQVNFYLSVQKYDGERAFALWNLKH